MSLCCSAVLAADGDVSSSATEPCSGVVSRPEVSSAVAAVPSLEVFWYDDAVAFRYLSRPFDVLGGAVYGVGVLRELEQPVYPFLR